MKNGFNSIFCRVFAAAFSVCAVVILGGAAVSYSVMTRSVERNTQRLLGDSVAVVAACIDAGVAPDRIAAALGEYSAKSGVRTTIIKPDGTVIFDSFADKASMENHLDRAEVKAAFAGKTNVGRHYSQTMRSKFVYVASPAGAGQAGAPKYCVRQSVDVQIPQAQKAAFKGEIVGFSAGALVVAVLLSLWTARKISVPLEELSKAAESFARERFDAAVPESRISEVSALSHSLSQMGADLKKRLSSLNKRNCELDEVLSQMRDCVFICSSDGEVRRYNRACSEIFAASESPRNPRVAGMFRNTAIIAAVEKIFKESAPVSAQFDFREKTYRLAGFPLPYESKHARALFVIRDVSEETRNDMLRREFVAGVSHELKTPITSIKMAAETVSENFDADTARRFLPTIIREADRMTALVDDMLLLSKVEFTRAGENFERVKVSDILALAVADNESQIESNSDAVNVDCPPALEFSVDARLAEIAVCNLVSNAVRYGGKACKIAVSAKDGGDVVEISVADSGAGISRENLPRVFERFYRVDKGRSRVLGGTGLGLALVKHIAILHGGSVSAESELGKGSRFTITFKKA